jgi:hypothetical protein
MDPLAHALARSPELFPLTLDPSTDRVTIIRLNEADYVQASFLDERVHADPTVSRRPVPWRRLQDAVAQLPVENASYIFHIGHVGSTLLSRLLGQHADIFSLREPAILRTFAQMNSTSGSGRWSPIEFDQRLGVALQLLSRTFQANQRAMIKATSFVSELAPNILARPSSPRAILMFVSTETYLASILGAPNSPTEARALAPSRLARLHRRIGQEHWNLSGMSLGEIVAMSWICEMSALSAAAATAGDRSLWLDFDQFLDDPAASLSAVFAHLGIHAASNEIRALLAGPEMRRYAKAPEHSYDTNLRRAVLAAGRRNHAAEISRGLAWLQEANAKVSSILGGVI